MPWFALDTHYLRDPKVQAAGAETPHSLSVFPALLAEAKQRADGGRVELTFRDLAHLLFVTEDEAREAVGALVSAGVLTCPDLSAPSFEAKFPAWRRWNERFRKAQQREGKAHEQAD